MKNIKKLLVGAVALAMCTAGLAVTSASAAKYTELSTVFEENYDGETVTANSTGTGEIITDSATGNKYMKMTAGWSSKQFGYSIPAISSGTIKIQFDYMKDADNLNKQSYMIIGNNNLYQAHEWLRLLATNNYGYGTVFTAFKVERLGTTTIMEADKWYTEQVIINVDTHEVTATLYEKGNAQALGTVHFDRLDDGTTSSAYNAWPYSATSFVGLRHFGDGDAYIDNISIKYVYEDPTLIFSENYDDEFSVTAIKSGTGEIITDAGTGNKYMKMTAGYGGNQFGYSIPAISSGKIRVKFDYMKNADNLNKQSYMILGNNNLYQPQEWLRLLSTNNYGYGTIFTAFKAERLGTTTLMEADKWYTEDVVIDVDTHEVTATLYEKGNAEALGTVHFDKLDDGTATSQYNAWPYSSTSFVGLRHFGDGDAYIDNISINYTYDDPVLDSDSIAIKDADGEEALVWTEVVPSAKVIDIDFKTTMSEDTMTGEYIYVTKKDSSEKVQSTVTYEKGVATVTASNDWELGTYTIHVSGQVKNIANVNLGDDFEVDFTVKQGKVSAVIEGVFAGETQVDSFAQVSAGNSVSLKADFTNNTGNSKTAKLVIGYYNSKGELVGVEDEDVEISADKNSTADVNYTIANYADAVRMKFFLLEGYSTVSPISVSYPLN